MIQWRWAGAVGLALVVIASGAGCGGWLTGTDRAEQATGYCQKARKLIEQRDFDGALAAYQKALAADPELAEAHLEIGLLYDDKKKDPVAAIYHYRRFLELQPDSSKRQLVKDFIERAKLSFLAKQPQSPVVDADAASRCQAEKTALLQENTMLQARVKDLEQALEARPVARAEPARPPESPVVARATETAPPPVPMSTPEPPRPERTHLVQKGDTLYSLAVRYYGSPAAWERIYQANRGTLPSKDQLKIGQQLVIP